MLFTIPFFLSILAGEEDANIIRVIRRVTEKCQVGYILETTAITLSLLDVHIRAL
jgi:hypothetical protein